VAASPHVRKQVVHRTAQGRAGTCNARRRSKSTPPAPPVPISPSVRTARVRLDVLAEPTPTPNAGSLRKPSGRRPSSQPRFDHVGFRRYVGCVVGRFLRKLVQPEICRRHEHEHRRANAFTRPVDSSRNRLPTAWRSKPRGTAKRGPNRRARQGRSSHIRRLPLASPLSKNVIAVTIPHPKMAKAVLVDAQRVLVE